jgi:hypothetical protein
LESYLNLDLPDGILVGFDRALEEPIVRFAENKGYNSFPLDKGLMIWVRPDLNQP